MDSNKVEKKISFIFHPFEFEKNNHVIEKSIDGVKRRYLKGITSGVKVDGHGEKITDQCIKSFHNQATSGDVLLYADKHGVNYSDDIGILTNSEITPGLDWITEYRLYDTGDNAGAVTLEKADKVWKQMKGLPPYNYPRQKGFSIEGFIPDDGILAMDEEGRRVIDKVMLDGVVLVPRPAYQTSIAQSIYKALDETAPWNVEKGLIKSFQNRLTTDDLTNSYFRKRYQIQDLLEDEIENIMGSPEIGDKQATLENLFKEYKTAMIDLIMGSSSLFSNTGNFFGEAEQILSEDVTEMYRSKSCSVYPEGKKATIIKSLITEVDKLILKLQ